MKLPSSASTKDVALQNGRSVITPVMICLLRLLKHALKRRAEKAANGLLYRKVLGACNGILSFQKPLVAFCRNTDSDGGCNRHCTRHCTRHDMDMK